MNNADLQAFIEEVIKLDPSICDNEEHLNKAKEYFEQLQSRGSTEKENSEVKNKAKEIKSKYLNLLNLMKEPDFDWSQMPTFVPPKNIPDEIYKDDTGLKLHSGAPPTKPWFK